MPSARPQKYTWGLARVPTYVPRPPAPPSPLHGTVLTMLKVVGVLIKLSARDHRIKDHNTEGPG